MWWAATASISQAVDLPRMWDNLNYNPALYVIEDDATLSFRRSGTADPVLSQTYSYASTELHAPNSVNWYTEITIGAGYEYSGAGFIGLGLGPVSGEFASTLKPNVTELSASADGGVVWGFGSGPGFSFIKNAGTYKGTSAADLVGVFSSALGISPWAAGDVLMIAWLSAGTSTAGGVYFGKNGTWSERNPNSQNPLYFVNASASSNNWVVHAILQDAGSSRVSGTFAISRESADLQYALPSGPHGAFRLYGT